MSSLWDMGKIGLAIQRGLNAMGIPTPKDWSGIESFLRGRKDEVLAEFDKQNQDGKLDFMGFVVSFLMSDVINYLPRETIRNDASPSAGASSSYTLTFAQIQRIAEDLVKSLCYKWISQIRKRDSRTLAPHETKIIQHVIDRCVETCVPNEDQIELTRPNGDFYGWETLATERVDFLMSLDNELQAQQLEELKRMRKHKDDDLKSKAVVTQLARPFTRSSDAAKKAPKEMAPKGDASLESHEKTIDKLVRDANKQGFKVSRLHAANELRQRKRNHPMKSAGLEATNSSSNTDSTSPEIAALFDTASDSNGPGQEERGSDCSMSKDDPVSENISISLGAIDRDNIFLFLPGASMDNTSSSSHEIAMNEPCEEGTLSSGSDPPPTLDDVNRTPLTSSRDPRTSLQNGNSMDLGDDNYKILHREPTEKRKAEEYPSDGNGSYKRRKHLPVESTLLSEETRGIDGPSANEPDPFEILEEASAPICEEQESSIVPQSLYSLLGPIWDRHVDLH